MPQVCIAVDPSSNSTCIFLQTAAKFHVYLYPTVAARIVLIEILPTRENKHRSFAGQILANTYVVVHTVFKITFCQLSNSFKYTYVYMRDSVEL